MTWTAIDRLRPGDLVTEFGRWSRTRETLPPKLTELSDTMFIVGVVKVPRGHFIHVIDRRHVTSLFFHSEGDNSEGKTMYYVIVKG